MLVGLVAGLLVGRQVISERVVILFQQRIGLLRKMPCLVHLKNVITFLQGFHNFDAALRSFDSSFGIGTRARGLIPCIGARSAEGEHQLVLSALR